MFLERWLIGQAYVETDEQVGHERGKKVRRIECDISHGHKAAILSWSLPGGVNGLAQQCHLPFGKDVVHGCVILGDKMSDIRCWNDEIVGKLFDDLCFGHE